MKVNTHKFSNEEVEALLQERTAELIKVKRALELDTETRLENEGVLYQFKRLLFQQRKLQSHQSFPDRK